MGIAPEGEAEGAGLGEHLPVQIRRWHVVAGICLINGYRRGAELGVSTGRFSFYLCGHMPDMRIHAVDMWQDQPKRDDEGAETYENRPHERNYQNVVTVNRDHLQGRMNILRMSTVAAAPLIKDGGLDFVFIDADHTEAGCKADILAWTQKVRSGGLVCGHDYNWPSVKRAVMATGGNIVKESDNVWLRFIP